MLLGYEKFHPIPSKRVHPGGFLKAFWSNSVFNVCMVVFPSLL